MTEQRPYASPAAFRQALTEKLRDKAKTSRWTLAQLQRHIAYDRLLARLYLVDDGWVVKGATALLARDIGVRGTLDIDVYRAKERAVAERELRDAVTKEIGDWFRFEIGAGQPLGDEGASVRLPVTAYIGPAIWAQFSVDLVGSDLRMTGEPEDVEPLARVEMSDFEQHGYRAYPLVDHIADKVAATYERHGVREIPSTRYRDLVDLVAIVIAGSVDAEPQMAALKSEAERRDITLPPRFDVPDRDLWTRGYASVAAQSLLPLAHALEEALVIVRSFLNPLLDGTAAGSWDAEQQLWTG